MKVDTLIKGTVLTMDPLRPVARDIGIHDGRIVYLGNTDKPPKDSISAQTVLDYRPNIIMPGFTDTHMHPFFSGLLYGGVDLSSCTNLNEVFRLLDKKIKKNDAGSWVIGMRFQDKLQKEQRFPSRAELDRLSRDQPILILHNDMHFLSMNTESWHRMNLEKDLKGIEVDKDGHFTGYITDPASLDVLNTLPALFTDNEVINSFDKIAQAAASYGITSVHAKDNLRILKLLTRNRVELPVRIKPLCMTENIKNMDLPDEILNTPHLGPDPCICIFADGTFDGYTGALLEPYWKDPVNFGVLNYQDGELYPFLKKAHTSGFQISCHTVGDRAIEQFLRIIEKILEESPRARHQHRMEHFELPSKEQLLRTAKLGCAVSLQPGFLETCAGPDLEGYRKFIGPERVLRTTPLRSILDYGILAAGGSDSPVTGMNPLEGIHNCLNHPVKDQRISIGEALALYTKNAARIGFNESETGTLSPGKLADITVLERNPFDVLQEEIRRIPVLMTMKGGRVVYSL